MTELIEHHRAVIPVTLEIVHDWIAFACSVYQLPDPPLPDTIEESIDMLNRVNQLGRAKLQTMLQQEVDVTVDRI